MNINSGYSHLRKHLGVCFVCGGCRAFKDTNPKHVSIHMEVCDACCIARGEKPLPPSHAKSTRSKGKAK